MNIDVNTERQGADAKQDAFDQALTEATKKLTEDILGADRAAHHWSNLRAKLLRNSSRYVLSMKSSVGQPVGGLTHLTVTLRLSPDNLETLLREEGALSSGGVRILPLVGIFDQHGSRYSWWAAMDEDRHGTESAPLTQELFRDFYNQLANKFKAKNMFVLDPTSSSFRMSIPASYRSEGLRREDQISFAQYLKADVVLSGRIGVDRTQAGELHLIYDLQLWQVRTGRMVTETQRLENLNSEVPKAVVAIMDQVDRRVFDELTSRLGEAVASGNLNLNVVKLAILGNLTYQQQADLKRQLGQLREIKILKDYLYEPGQVVLEAETPVSGLELGKVLQKTRFPAYNVQVGSVREDGLALNVRPSP